LSTSALFQALALRVALARGSVDHHEQALEGAERTVVAADRQIVHRRCERSAIQRGDHRIGRLRAHVLRRPTETEDRRQLDRHRAAAVARGADPRDAVMHEAVSTLPLQARI